MEAGGALRASAPKTSPTLIPPSQRFSETEAQARRRAAASSLFASRPRVGAAERASDTLRMLREGLSRREIQRALRQRARAEVSAASSLGAALAAEADGVHEESVMLQRYLQYSKLLRQAEVRDIIDTHEQVCLFVCLPRGCGWPSFHRRYAPSPRLAP